MSAPSHRRLILTITGIIWLLFVWFLLPNRNVSLEMSATLGQPAQSSPGTVPLRLVSLDIPPRTADAGQLIFRNEDSESTIELSVGKTVSTDATTFEVTTIRPWAGLIHRAPGVPMLNVAVRPPGGAWIENVFVQRGSATIVTPEIAVLVDGGDAGIATSGARWGIAEDDRTHWFSSFVPGTGLELDGGDVITLLARQPSARILVEIEADGGTSQVWVEANRYEPDGRIRYEDPGAVDCRIEIDPNTPLTITVVERDLERWSRAAELGSILLDDESGLSVRIDQNEREAFALFAGESPWLEVVLSNPSRVLRIREGEAIRLGEDTVTFEALANPQPIVAQVMVGGTTVPFTETTVHEFEDWRFDTLRALSPTEIALEATYTNRQRALRIGLTALFFAAVIVHLYTARRRA